MTDDPAARELERIQSEYRRRDAEGPGPGLGDAAHRAHVDDLERELVRAIGDAGASLAGASVLDVGAGDGHLLQRMVDLGAAKGAGIELMQDRVDAAAGGTRSSTCASATPRSCRSPTPPSTS